MTDPIKRLLWEIEELLPGNFLIKTPGFSVSVVAPIPKDKLGLFEDRAVDYLRCLDRATALLEAIVAQPPRDRQEEEFAAAGGYYREEGENDAEP